MRTEIQKLLTLSSYFNIIQANSRSVKVTLKEPSQLLMQNIYLRWLESIWGKAKGNFPVFKVKNTDCQINKLPVGFITPRFIDIKNSLIEYDVNDSVIENKTNLEFKLMVPQQEMMQYFIQWQRYRKYWWSMITTTPSLFGIDDIKYLDESTEVDIVAKLQNGKHCVECVSMQKTGSEDTAEIKCVTNIEDALFTTLLDGTLSSTKEGYLRLHRTIAPYKFSFALDCKDPNGKSELSKLALLINSRLTSRNISTLYPDFGLELEPQITENLKMGVVYTIILSEATLQNGIFHLLNSSTMLKEQVHVATFDSYASLLSGLDRNLEKKINKNVNN